MKKGTVLNHVFDRLKSASVVVEKYADKFARSKTFGFVTSCPTNLGTGMRASVHVKLPNLTADGSDAKAKSVCKPLGLSVRGLGGEHTPIGADGTVDISPSGRLMIEEAAIICNLYQGIRLCLQAEANASKNGHAKNGGNSHGHGSFLNSSMVVPAILIGSAAAWIYLSRRN